MRQVGFDSVAEQEHHLVYHIYVFQNLYIVLNRTKLVSLRVMPPSKATFCIVNKALSNLPYS